MSIAGTALLTGASGFIGKRLRERLGRAGLHVTALRRSSSPEPSGGRSLVVDYEDVAALEQIVEAERPDYVFHVAGVTKGVTYDDFRRGNVVPTKNLLEALRKAAHSIQRFVHVSSLASYGPSTLDRPHEETVERKPIEHYGQSKLEAEEVVESFKDEVPWTIIRPGGVYGPGDVDYFKLFQSVDRGFNVFFGNRQRRMSVVYVDDVVQAIIAAAESDRARGRGYFICDGRPVSFEAFQQCIVDACGRRVRDLDLPEILASLAAFGGEILTSIDGKPRLFNRQKALMGKQIAWTCTHAAARADFDYAPSVPLEEGVKRTFEWYRGSGWLPGLPPQPHAPQP